MSCTNALCASLSSLAFPVALINKPEREKGGGGRNTTWIDSSVLFLVGQQLSYIDLVPTSFKSAIELYLVFLNERGYNIFKGSCLFEVVKNRIAHSVSYMFVTISRYFHVISKQNKFIE